MAKQTKEVKDDKSKILDETVKTLKERFGEGSIMKLGEVPKVDIDVISTGSLSLDMALGVGGVPRGRIIEVYGPESSGKTTLALHVVAEAQKRGGLAAFVDAEHALDPEYAKKIGVKINELLISQPDNGEQALEIVESLVRSNSCDVIVVDSVAALTPRAEIEGEMGDSHMGLQARLMSQALRKLNAIAAKSNTAVIFINQLRMKIGVFFGNPETQPGGMALKFYSSVRLDVRRNAQIKKGEEDRKLHAYEGDWDRWRSFYRGDWKKNIMPVNLFFTMVRTTVPRIYFRNPSISVSSAKPGFMHMAVAKTLERADNKMLQQMVKSGIGEDMDFSGGMNQKQMQKLLKKFGKKKIMRF